jgi:hypothetical protein
MIKTNVFILSLFGFFSILNTCSHDHPSHLNFTVPEPGILNMNNNSLFNNYKPKRQINSHDPNIEGGFTQNATRVLQSSSGGRNLKVHVDFYSLASLSVDKRVYIECKIINIFNW